MSAESKRLGSNFISKNISREHSIIFDCLAVLLCVVSFILSWVESSVNSDSHHWGFMYVPALDLKHGLLPYRDILIAYGYLTTWIQAVSLSVLGESLKSIGIVTGLFYSMS